MIIDMQRTFLTIIISTKAVEEMKFNETAGKQTFASKVHFYTSYESELNLLSQNISLG